MSRLRQQRRSQVRGNRTASRLFRFRKGGDEDVGEDEEAILVVAAAGEGGRRKSTTLSRSSVNAGLGDFVYAGL
jgi:hypothetical protein